MQATKHASEGSTLALKPRGDVVRSPKQGYQWPHEKAYVLQKFKKYSSVIRPKPIICLKKRKDVGLTFAEKTFHVFGQDSTNLVKTTETSCIQCERCIYNLLQEIAFVAFFNRILVMHANCGRHKYMSLTLLTNKIKSCEINLCFKMNFNLMFLKIYNFQEKVFTFTGNIVKNISSFQNSNIIPVAVKRDPSNLMW